MLGCQGLKLSMLVFFSFHFESETLETTNYMLNIYKSCLRYLKFDIKVEIKFLLFRNLLGWWAWMQYISPHQLSFIPKRNSHLMKDFQDKFRLYSVKTLTVVSSRPAKREFSRAAWQDRTMTAKLASKNFTVKVFLAVVIEFAHVYIGV